MARTISARQPASKRAQSRLALGATDLHRRLFEPVDIASLAWFRIAFGAVLLWEVLRYFQHGWIESMFMAPRVHFTYYGFEWIRPWPGTGMFWHFLGLGVLACLILVGLWYRWATGLFAVGFAYVFLLDKAYYLNHFYLVLLLSGVMVVVPAHRAWSVDAARNPALQADYVPAWSLWLLRFQVGIPYVYGGLAKLNGDWLQGHPMQMWMSRMEEARSIVPWFGEHWLALVFSYGGLLLDLLVVPGLLWRRTRPLAFSLAVGFHLFNAAVFRIGIFPWLMICATTLFLAPDWPRRVLRLPAPPQPRRGSPTGKPWGWRRGVAVVLAIHLILQVSIPFRHWLYPGNVDWTEEGNRFSWRMMLCDKTGVMRILMTELRSGHSTDVDLRQWLTPQQLERLGRDPEILREFATLLTADAAAKGLGDVEVRVYTLCSLNGRKPQLLVDPTMDLGRQPRRLGSQSWIVPLQEPLRAEPWLVPLNEWEERLARDRSR